MDTFASDPSLQTQQEFYPDPTLAQGTTNHQQAAVALGHSNNLLQSIIRGGENLLPTAGAIIGGIGGGAVGGALGAETGPGAAATAYGGAVAGSGVGASAGEALKEKLQGGNINPGEVAKQGGIYAGLEAVGTPILSAAGKLVEGAGSLVAKMFIPKSEAESGMLQAYKGSFPTFASRIKAIATGSYKEPTTAASTAFKKGLMGTEGMMGVQAVRAQSKLWKNMIQPALKQSTEKVDMSSFLKDAENKIISETNDPTRKNVLLNALNSIKEDFSGVGEVGLDQLQKYKQGWAEFVPEKAYKGESIAGAVNDVRNKLAGMARQKIYDSLGDNVKEAYLDYGNLEGIKALGKKAGAGGIVKPGGTFTGLKGLFEAATVPVGTIGGQTIYRVGQGIELLGKPGLRSVRDLLGLPVSGATQSEAQSTPTSSQEDSGFVPDPSLQQ